jgi:hypothetical protein
MREWCNQLQHIALLVQRQRCNGPPASFERESTSNSVTRQRISVRVKASLADDASVLRGAPSPHPKCEK